MLLDEHSDQPQPHFRKRLFTIGLAAVLALGAGALSAEERAPAGKIYVDPVTGEVIEYQKLLSEMTEEEKASLTAEEIKKLEEIEAAAKAKAELEKPGY